MDIIGIKNIILHLGTEIFPRIKVGVGEKPKGWDLADYVLGRYSAEDRKIIDEAQKEAAEAVKMMVMDDIRGAMNRYNTKKKADSRCVKGVWHESVYTAIT